jgi:hypothetical protein
MILKRNEAMFVYYFVHLRLAFDTVERRLLDVLSGLEEYAAAAYREGEKLRATVGVGGDSKPLIAKTVEIDVGEPLRGQTETEVPISWRATGAPGLFPQMDAGIVVGSLGPELTQLILRGSYEPPFGLIGRALDRTMFHRVAEASVKGFVDRIATSIEHEGLPHKVA